MRKLNGSMQRMMSCAMGIFEALQGGGIDDATKEAFLGNAPYLTGCGGLDELYAVLRGESYEVFPDSLAVLYL